MNDHQYKNRQTHVPSYKSTHCSEDESATSVAIETQPLCNQSLSNCAVAEERTCV